MEIRVHFSSKTDDWETPKAFFEALDKVHHFTLDVCADKKNAKCSSFFSKKTNALSQRWHPERCWMNPPYGRTIGHWMKKAYDESRLGAIVVCLVPARTDTAWWHDYAMKGEIEFIRGRLKFGRHKNSAPFPSAVVTFSPWK